MGCTEMAEMSAAPDTCIRQVLERVFGDLEHLCGGRLGL
jgi:hypothetical protein